MTRSLPLLLLLAAASLTRAQDLPVAGATDQGHGFRGTVLLEGAGAARVAVATLDIAVLGRHTLRAPAPGPGPIAGVRVLERAGGLAGAMGGGPGLDLVALLERPGLATQVDSVRGAYFRKVVGPASSRYVGLHGEGRLPLLTFDPDRQHTPSASEAAWLEGPLDRPSVYMGGRADGYELDAGLTWDRVYDARGRPVLTDLDSDGGVAAHRFVFTGDAFVDGAGRETTGEPAHALRARLRPAFAFRPFWRTTGAENLWHNPRPGTPENIYLYPGQPFAMRVEVAGRDRVRLVVRGAAGAPSMSVTFAQPGFGRGRPQTWKRVSSIDQFRETLVDGERRRRGNEGRDVLPTRTRATGMTWLEVSLLEADGARTPLMGAGCREVRGADTAPRYGDIFRLRGFSGRGGEELDIRPPS